MTKIFYISFFSLLLFSCKAQTNKEQYNVRTDIRLSTKFYSIYMNEEGEAYINVFKIDSVKIFFENLNKSKANTIIGVKRADAPRVEIYYDHQKIYDAYRWDETFWNLFRPIMEEIPKGFSPFRESDKPFAN